MEVIAERKKRVGVAKDETVFGLEARNVQGGEPMGIARSDA